MASRLVQTKSVEQFRQMHEAGIARYVDDNRNELAAFIWGMIEDRLVEEALSCSKFWYYVEEDEE